MVKTRIRLDTLSDVNEFVKICSTYDIPILLTDDSGNFIVNAKSLLGCLYSMEWDKIYCCYDDLYRDTHKDILNKIDRFKI